MTDMIEHPGRSGEPRQAGKYLCFVLGDETLATNVLVVKEILEYTTVTTVPMMPDFVSGVVNLRGRAVPVVNLAERLGLKREDNDQQRRCIVVVEAGDADDTIDVGLTVDAVSTVRDIEPDQIEPAPSFRGRVHVDFIEGMARLSDDGFVVVLDIAKVLSLDDLNLLAEAERAVPAPESAC